MRVPLLNLGGQLQLLALQHLDEAAGELGQDGWREGARHVEFIGCKIYPIDLGDVEIEEVAVEDCLDTAGHDGDNVIEALGVVAPDPVEDVQAWGGGIRKGGEEVGRRRMGRMRIRGWLGRGEAEEQCCSLLPKFRRYSELEGFQEIAQDIAQKCCAIFRFMLQSPKTPPNE